MEYKTSIFFYEIFTDNFDKIFTDQVIISIKPE